MIRYASIRLKIAVTLAVSILLLVTGVSLTLYANIRDTVKSQLMADYDNVMRQYEGNIKSLTQTIQQVTFYIVMDSTFMDILHADTQDPVQAIHSVKKLNRRFADYIFVPLSMHLTDYTAAFFVNREMPFASLLNGTADLSQKGVYSDEKVETLPWFRSAAAKNGQLIWFTGTDDNHRLYTARLIKNPWPLAYGEATENVGMVVIGFDVSQFGKLAESSTLTDNSRILLTSTDGTIIYSENDALIGDFWPGTKAAFRNGSYPEMQSITFEGESYLTKIYPLEQGFSLVSLIPAADIEAKISGVKRTILNIYLAAVLIALVLAWLISKLIARPIKRLASIMKGYKFENGLETVVSSSLGRDEIALLYASFDNMIRRIQQLVQDNDESRLQQRMAEIRALQAQINPHFIYNTLDSVNWLALGTGEKRLPAMVSSLVDILRYSIRESEQLVTVEEEIRQLAHYVTIQSIRYNGAFRFDVEVDADVRKEPCPKLTLQPLVENAIIHGGVGAGEGDLIRVLGCRTDGRILLRIIDNGAGTSERAMAIQASLQEGGAKAGGAGSSAALGHGIRNVDTRIKLHFGTPYGLSYEANVGSRGFAVTVALPATASETPA